MSSLKGDKAAGPGDWVNEGKCRDNPQLFDPMEHGGTRQERRRIASAKAVCESCRVAADCLSWGLANRGKGVWGGQYLNDGHVRGIKPKAA